MDQKGINKRRKNAIIIALMVVIITVHISIAAWYKSRADGLQLVIDSLNLKIEALKVVQDSIRINE